MRPLTLGVETVVVQQWRVGVTVASLSDMYMRPHGCAVPLAPTLTSVINIPNAAPAPAPEPVYR